MNRTTIISFLTSCLFLTFQNVRAQQFWAGGFVEHLDTIANGQVLIQSAIDTVLIQDFDSPVQFEATMTGILDDQGEILFYTNGCHIYDKNHEIILDGELLNPGEVHDLTCDDYGYIAPKGASIVTFLTHPNLYYLIHIGLRNTISHSLSYGPLYLTQILFDTTINELKVLSKNEVLLDFEIDPFELIRHGNGNDWWLITNAFGSADYHKILLTPGGYELYDAQKAGYTFPFPSCRWQRSLSAAPSGNRLVRFSSSCGVQYLTFDRCTGQFSNAGFSHLENKIFGGGGSVFSEDSEFVYFSRWHRIIKARFDNPPDTLRTSFSPTFGFGGSFVHMHRDPFGRIYIAPQAAEPYLHAIEPGDHSPDTALVDFEGLRLPKRMARTIPHYPNYDLGSLSGSFCDTLLSGINIPVPIERGVSLSPNPAKELIRVKTTFPGAKKIVLLNTLGQVLQTHLTHGNRYDLTLSGYAEGIYLISVQFEDDTFFVKKFHKAP